MEPMKRLNVTVNCSAVYNSSIMVPADMNFEEAIEYAKKHIDSIPIQDLTYIYGSDTLDIDNCDFDDSNVKNDVAYVMYNITRIRQYENEYWNTSIYVKISSPNSPNSDDAAKQLLIERIQKRLASKRGWESICRASMDFNWGDLVMELPYIDDGIFDETRVPPTPPIGVFDLSVNQDELLAPAAVSAELKFFEDNNCIRSVPCKVDFRDGTISTKTNEREYIEKATRAYVKLNCGDTIMCDASEDYMRLMSASES